MARMKHQQPPPFGTYLGRTVTWSEGRLSHPAFICPPNPTDVCACGERDTIGFIGRVHPLPGETEVVERTVPKTGGRTRTVGVTVPARPSPRLFATRCVGCGALSCFDHEAPGRTFVEILCDGCDLLIGIGGDEDEARSNVLGTTGNETDLCLLCSPGVRRLRAVGRQ